MATTTDRETDTTTVNRETLGFKLEEGMSADYSSARPPLINMGQEPDIKTFLNRPILYGNYSWLISAATGVDIFNFDISNVITTTPMYQLKLQGFRNIKATICFKLVLAPSPFHAGAIRLSWLPFTMNNGNLVGNMYKGLIPNSQLPGIMVTCEENSAEMKIPYVGPMLGYDRNSSSPWGWGNLRCTIYSTLNAGSGAGAVALDLYTWLEDVELGGVTAQSGFKATKKYKNKNMLITDSEIGDGSGPISRVLGSAATLANRLGDFPVLTPFMKPAAWVLNGLRGSAESFGYSKPTTGESVDYCMMVRNQDAYSTNMNGKDNVISLSTLGDAKTTMHHSLQTTNQIEDSIDFIKRKWSYLTNFAMTTTNSPGDILYSNNIAPRSLANTYTVSTGGSTNYTVAWMTPVAYLGELFECYRGDIEVRFVFVKTGFHACQLEVSFSMDSAPTTDTSYYLREIVDIQKGNEVCFILPYAKVEPFLSTFDNFGTLRVKVITSLQAPSTVANSINVMVFYRGGENLVYARPSTACPVPVMGPQGAYTEDSHGDICDSRKPIGNALSFKPDMFSQFTVGEHYTSLKQLCNKYTETGFKQTTLSGASLLFDPHYPGSVTTTLGTTTTITFSGLSLDYMARFSFLFLYHTGSVKIRVKNLSSGARGVKALLLPFQFTNNVDIIADPGTSTNDSFTRSDYLMDMNLLSNGFRVPQYSKFLGYPNIKRSGSTNVPLYGQSFVILSSSDGSNLTSSNIGLYRSVGEDFQFQFFLAIPTCLYSVYPA